MDPQGIWVHSRPESSRPWVKNFLIRNSREIATEIQKTLYLSSCNTCFLHLILFPEIKNFFFQNRLIDTENKHMLTRGDRVRGVKRQMKEIKRHRLPLAKQMSHVYEVYSSGNIVSNHVISNIFAWWYILTYFADQFEMYTNNKSLCCVTRINIML